MACKPEAGRRVPGLNAPADGNDIICPARFDTGVAPSTGPDLIVPVVRKAGSRTFAEIGQRIADYGGSDRARRSATFTITGGGARCVDVRGDSPSTPRRDPGTHAIRSEPVIDGLVAARPTGRLASGCGHRIVDGRAGVRFPVALSAPLEDPARLLMQV